MPALVAVRHDPHLRAFYQILLARHKAKLQALVAVARKMLHANDDFSSAGPPEMVQSDLLSPGAPPFWRRL